MKRPDAHALVSVATMIVALAIAASGLVFLIYGVTARPWTEIESQLVYEAHRISAGAALYVDPIAGAWDDGPPPSHFHVLYPPLYVFALSAFHASSFESTRAIGRVESVVLFVGMLALVVRAAAPRNRRATAIAALSALGLDLIVREAGLAQTDVPAIALVTLALVRTARAEKLDGVSAALFAVTPLVKHSVIGAALGALVAHLITTRPRGMRAMIEPLLRGAIAPIVLLVSYHFVSGGEWLRQILHATGQPLSFERWTHEFGSRVLLLGLPHAVILILAVKRRAPLRISLPLAISLIFTTIALAKHGSATHYWIEPTMAALVALAQLPPPPEGARRSIVLPLAALALVIAIAASSLPAFARAPATYAAWDRSLEAIAAACPRAPGQVVMSSDVRIEVALDRRPIIAAWETSHMVRSGTFPIGTWREELARPQVKCLVMEPWFDAPLPEGAALRDVSVYRRELRPDVERLFLPGIRAGDFLVMRRREL